MAQLSLPFDTIVATLPLAALAGAGALAAMRLRRSGAVAHVVDGGAPNAGEVDVLVLVDITGGPTGAPAHAARTLGPRIRRLTLALLTGSEPPTSLEHSPPAREALEPVEVFRPTVLVVHGDAEAAATQLARSGAYDLAVVSEGNRDAAAALARRAGLPVLVVREHERPSTPRPLARRGSLS